MSSGASGFNSVKHGETKARLSQVVIIDANSSCLPHTLDITGKSDLLLVFIVSGNFCLFEHSDVVIVPKTLDGSED